MARHVARGIFLALLALAAGFLVLAVYQVPQPWRGVLVAWLLFSGTGGLLILRIVRHYYAYKTLQLTTKQPASPQGPHTRTGQPAGGPFGFRRQRPLHHPLSKPASSPRTSRRRSGWRLTKLFHLPTMAANG